MKRLSVTAFQDSVTDLVAQLRRRIELEVEAFPVDARAKADRRQKALAPDGFGFFAETYFPHYHDRAPSRLHEALHRLLPEVVADARGRKVEIIAPRGSAKSTKVSLEFLLWVAISGAKKFPIIVSDASEQAELLLEAVKAELELNPRLASDFPEATGQGRLWRAHEIVTANDARIVALGSGKKIRGRRHGPHRPDLVILDDLENDENVKSPDQRDKLEAWIDKAVLKSGPADGSLDLLFVGTILHHDSVLARKSRAPGWEVHKFAAILRMPDRTDLWERFEETLLNNGEEVARAYYAKNRAVMDAGAELDWPGMQTLVGLMIEKAENYAAFMSERQNEPISENAPFRTLVFWVAKRQALVFFGAIDPSLGRHGKSRDPSAILIGGFDRASGELDVYEASIRKRLPDTIIADAIALQREYRCALWFVEAVQFQEFLRTEIMRRAAKEGLAFPAIPIIPIADKTLRIERLQPPAASGLIRLHQSQRTLIEQLQQWPLAAHDDGPDCLEMLWTGALKHGAAALDPDRILGAGGGGGGGLFGGYRL